MNIEKYKKGINAELDKDYKESDAFGKVMLGKQNVFWKKGFSTFSVPLDSIKRAYRRVEEVTASTSCCSNDFSIHHLILEFKDGDVKDVMIGDSFFRHEPEMLIEKFKELPHDMIVGIDE